MVDFGVIADLAPRLSAVYELTPKLSNVQKGPSESTPKLLIVQSNPREYSETVTLVPELWITSYLTPDFHNVQLSP